MLIIKYNGGFAHSKRSTLNVTNATFNTEVMALQCGTELFQGSTLIQHYEVLTAGTGGELKTTFTAQGTAGAEILFLYQVDPSNGTYIKTFTQTTSEPASGQFSYTSSSKTFTFNASETPKQGDMFAVTYQFKSADNAQVITMNGTGVPSTCLVTAYGLAKDTCTGELFPCQVDGKLIADTHRNMCA